jgi:hypothetical protein
VVAAGDQASLASAQPHLSLLTDVLDGFGVVFEPEFQVATGFRGIAIGPGPFDQGPTSMGIAGFSNGTLPVVLATGVFRGDQPQEIDVWFAQLRNQRGAEKSRLYGVMVAPKFVDFATSYTVG